MTLAGTYRVARLDCFGGRVMLRITFLRNMLLLSLVLVTVLPLYDLFYIYPTYRNLLTRETEDDAVRFVNYLVRVMDLDEFSLDRTHISTSFAKEANLLMKDGLLVKLRVFSPQGEIIFSTVPDEIGRINNSPYFHQVVARGRIYSKVVSRDRQTAEGRHLPMDVVETYVPVMTSQGFGGAMEVYYDITENQRRIDELTRRSTLLLLGLCSSMLVVILLLLYKAKNFWVQREQAETELQENNEALEERIQERTGQLLLANQQLTTEIAERTLAQAALKASLAETEAAKEKINGILNSVADGLLVIDQQQRVVLMNATAEAALGVSFAAVADRPLAEGLGESRPGIPFLEAMANPCAGGQFDFPSATQVPGQEEKVYQGRCSPLLSQSGEISGQIVLMQDVSRERALERMKSEFLAMAAHELHTPITTIMGYTELLVTHDLEEFQPEQRREFINYIYDKAQALARMVDDLLDVSRIEAGQLLSLKKEYFSFSEVLDQARQLPLLSNRHQLKLDIEPEAIDLYADRLRVEQLLANLLGNAVKYSPDGGEIGLEARIVDDQLQVIISDEGIGMSEEQAAHAFERFYRADTSTTAVAGTGLGMSVAKIIVDAHGGDIWIESSEGIGTRVFFRLPLKSGD